MSYAQKKKAIKQVDPLIVLTNVHETFIFKSHRITFPRLVYLSKEMYNVGQFIILQ